MRRTIPMNKAVLALSVCAFLLLAAPAYVPAMAGSIVSAVLLAVLVWRFPVPRERLRELLTASAGCFAASAAICAAFGCNFYETWLDSRNAAAIADALHLSVQALVGAAAAVLALAAVPSMTVLLTYYCRLAVKQCRALDRPQRGVSVKAALGILSVVFVVGIAAILRANYYYNDDLERAAHGYKMWPYGRVLANALSSILHMGSYLTDTAPLPQLAAALILALAGVSLLLVFYDRRRFTAWELVAVLPLGLNPYFLECLSYRYDAPYMALSVLFGIVPLLFRRAKPAAYIFAAALGMVGVCTSYQAATGIFPMLVIVLCARLWASGHSWKEIGAFCGQSVLGYALGLLYFRFALMIPFTNTYVESTLPSLAELLPTVAANLSSYYRLILSDFKTAWLLLALLCALGAVIAFVRHSQRHWALSLLMAALALTLMGLLCFGLYPAMTSVLFAPRAMYGFGVLLTLLCLSCARPDASVLRRLPAVALSWVFFVFSFTYGNALYVQAEYSDYRIREVVAELNTLEALQTGQQVIVQISGSVGSSPVLENMPQDYGMLNRLVPSAFGGSPEWACYGLYYYYGLDNVIYDPNADLSALPLVQSTADYDIYSDGVNVRVELK